MNHEYLAVIPARSGSKRIPRKNIADFMGRPMIEWTIRAALDSRVVKTVFVSTDDSEIAAVAERAGAEVPFLRKLYADDDSPVSLATLEFLQRLEDEMSIRSPIIIQLMANCPLRGAEDIRKSVSYFTEGSHSFQISAVNYGWLSPWWAHEQKPGRSAQPLFPEAISRRSQDLPELLCPTGAVWIASVDAFREARTFYGPGYQLFPLDWRRGIDIDTPEDLSFAMACAPWLEKPLLPK